MAVFSYPRSARDRRSMVLSESIRMCHAGRVPGGHACRCTADPRLGHQAVHVRAHRRRPHPADARGRSERRRPERGTADLRRRAGVEHDDGRVHGARQRPARRRRRLVSQPRAWSSTPRPASARSTSRPAWRRSAIAPFRTRACSGRSSPTSISGARRSRRSDPTSTASHKGGFTTCVQPTPRWDVVSGSATINLDDYAILRNAVVRVKDVPVFYLPALYYPIQSDDRATGFLLPTYGRSTVCRVSRSATRSSGRSTAARI